MSTRCPGRPEVPAGVLPAGWVRADCHLHTLASGDAVTTLDQLVRRASEACTDVVCITDHNVMSAAEAAAARGIGPRVILGAEIRTAEGDIIGMFLTERIPYVLPAAEVAGRIRQQGGLVYGELARSAGDLAATGGDSKAGRRDWCRRGGTASMSL